MKDLNRLCLGCFRELNGEDVCPHCGFVRGSGPARSYYLSPGTLLDERYIIGNAINCGGFGIIYKAYDAVLDLVVAIKEFYISNLASRPLGASKIEIFTQNQSEQYQAYLERFKEEANNLALFSKDAEIVTVYNRFEANDTAYIVMEFIEGMLISDYLEEYGKMPPQDATRILGEILQALEKLHKKGIIHRDISPDNIFLCEGNHIKLIDFGAAYFEDGESNQIKEDKVVKNGFSPPEQYIDGAKPSPAMDIYAAGAVYYQMLTAEKPLGAMDRAAGQKLRPLSEFGVRLPGKLQKALECSLQLDRDDRYQSASDFRKIVQEGIDRPVPGGMMKFLIAGISVAVLMILVAVGIGMYIYSNDLLVFTPEKGTEITAWLMIEDLDEESSHGMPSESILLSSFNSSLYGSDKNDQVKLHVEYIEESKYAERIKNCDTSELPDVFCVDEISKSDRVSTEDLSPLIKKLPNQYYLFEKQYVNQYPRKTEIPTGFQVSVCYEDFEKLREEGIETNGVLNLGSGSLKEGSYEWMDTRGDLEKTVYQKLGGKDAELSAAIGSLSLWQKVNSQMVQNGSELQILPMVDDDGKLMCSFCGCYAVKASKDKQVRMASMQFLYYLLSHYMQGTLYAGSDMALPVNAKTYQEYMNEVTGTTEEASDQRFDLGRILENIEVRKDGKIYHVSDSVHFDNDHYSVYSAYAGEVSE